MGRDEEEGRMTSIELSIFSSVLVTFLLGIFVLWSQSYSHINRNFFIVSGLASFWLLSNFLVISDPTSIFFQRTITPTSTLAMLGLIHFFYNYPLKKKLNRYISVIYGLSVPIFLLSFTDLNVYTKFSEKYELGALFYYYSLYLVVCAFFTLSLICTIIKNPQNDTKKIVPLIAGIITTIITAILIGILPPFLGENRISDYTFLTILPFFIVTSMTIMRRDMFDIKYFAWRSVVYTVSLMIVISTFVISLIASFSFFLDTSSIKADELIIYIFITAITIALFEPTKKIVNNLTEKIFFQNTYSLHNSISKITNYATKSIDSKRIQRNSLQVIDQTIKPDYAFFLIYEKDNSLNITEKIGVINDYPKVSEKIMKFRANAKNKVIDITRQLSASDRAKVFFEMNRTSLIVKLSTNNKHIGYIFFGEKKSGSSYTKQDFQFLELIANDLALALENAQRYDEIKQFNETLQQKISDATAALRRTNKKLIALDDVKDEFISMTSHQLRTPLTSVKGYISMLLEEDLGKLNSKQKMALKEAFDSSQRMVFLISDFLNVSRIRTGKFLIEPKIMNMSEVIRDEIQQLKEMAGFREQKVTLNASEDFPQVLLDENKVRQVMMNMIDNAIFYTPKGGEITITLEHKDHEIIFTVKDSGIGVPKEQQHRLFTKFFRAENARQARPDGTGLGLFMAQKIISAQHGSIIFHSIENEGSTFGFRFPDSIIVKNP